MATAKKKQTPSTAPNLQGQPYLCSETAQWGGYVNVRLNEEQKGGFNAWFQEHGTLYWEMMIEVIGDGMKVSFAYDNSHSCYMVTFTGNLLRTPEGDRFVCTSRSASLEEAMALAVWKHFILAHGDYSNYMPKTQNFMQWG